MASRLFYLRGVAPPEISTPQIYRGVVPFIAIQVLLLAGLWFVPELATYLPGEGVRTRVDPQPTSSEALLAQCLSPIVSIPT